MFFLMCSERSGSNFITKLLNGHNNICGPSTKHIINPVARNLFRYGNLKNKQNWTELLKDIERLLKVRFSIWKHEFDLNELETLAPTGDIKSLIKNIFLAEAKANGKQHIFIKENQIYEFLPFLLINYPEAKYIYLTRDPRDMALSWKKNEIHPGGVVKAAQQWRKDQQNNIKNYVELKKIGKAHFVKYEDLISDAKTQLEAIISFLGLPYDPNIQNYYKDELTQKNASMQKAWNNLSKEIIVNNKRKYLNELDTIEIKVVEKICFLEMQWLGDQTEHTKSELNDVHQNIIEELNVVDLINLKANRTEGVLANMEAKKIFYQKDSSKML